MKLVQVLAVIGFFLGAWPAAAQDDSALYRIADVVVDVSAATAAAARDQAILKAQHEAFDELLTRLGTSALEGVTDDDVAFMVRAFEVQKEHAAGQRYTGTYTVQFKPNAVRQYLYQRRVPYTEERAQPVVILPLLRTQGRLTLWEDRTPWRNAWEETASKAVLVPMVVPSGDLSDIALISGEEALAGRAENLQKLMEKYQAGGAMVAVLDADVELGNAPVQGQIAVYPYDRAGEPRDTFHVAIAPTAGAETLEQELKQGVGRLIEEIEQDWRQAHAQVAPPGNVPAQQMQQPDPAGFQVFLPVDVPVPNLAVWAQIRERLNHIPLVEGTHVITMTRGLVHIELQFRGDIASLQSSLAAKGLRLEQGYNGGWQIKQDNGPAAL